jgi:hypothetical protein
MFMGANTGDLMPENFIEFHAINKEWYPAPYPAVKSLPEWYKNLPADVSLPGMPDLGTAKQCRPFLDAMAFGYIIPLSGDVHFSTDAEGKVAFDCPNGDVSMETHLGAQVDGSPWDKGPVVKFINPWLVVTPPGYSTLFAPPLNRAPIPFNIFTGVVETDTFYAEIHFPAACLLPPGTGCSLPRGMPLVQAIPFKREDWRHETTHADARRLEETRLAMAHSRHLYREEHRQPKKYL